MLILRWHRERHYPVAAQIRGLMPRFLNMTDSEILAASFKLSDALEMVAKRRARYIFIPGMELCSIPWWSSMPVPQTLAGSVSNG